MLNIYSVAFFGHRCIYRLNDLEKTLETHICNLVKTKEYVEFMVGRSGDFDHFATAAVRRVQRNYRDENSDLVLILPYPTAEYLKNQKSFEDYYNDIEISNNASVAHPKAAYQIRNREMVDRADLIICYVEQEYGGAYQAVKYALSQGKTIINLAPEKL